MSAPTDDLTTSTPPNEAGYPEFRLAAEWASAVRGAFVNFKYGRSTGRISPHDTTDPPLRTPKNATRPQVVSVTFEVPGPASPATLTLQAADCGALLWSESAVEKFLFPYYASTAADGADRFLGRLSDAWYGYPGHVVQVCALAFTYGAQLPAGDLSLEDTVQLVCLERATATLKAMSLCAFEKTYLSGTPRGAPAAPTAAGKPVKCGGWTVGAEISSIVLRETAEFVSGLRGRFVWFTLKDGVLTPWICPTQKPDSRPDEQAVVAGGVAPFVRPDRPAPSQVTLKVGATSRTLVSSSGGAEQVPDSVFWTDGAVEGLLLPYYASVKGSTAPVYIAALMEKWNGIILPGTSDPREVAAKLLELLPGAAGTRNSTVFAAIHLPYSEYVGQGVRNGASGPALERRTRLLTLDVAEPPNQPLFGDAPVL